MDYVYDDYGNEKPMSDTAQRIYILIRTTPGSRANWKEFGMETPTHINSNISREVERFVRKACKPVISDGSARIDSIEVVSEDNKVLAIIGWTDMRQQREENTSVPLAQ